jgi:hypothetical protein
MYTRTDEIKYTDEIDHIIDGVLAGEISESLRHFMDALSDERFRSYIKESKHIDEVVGILVDREIVDPAVLEMLDLVFNPYSVDIEKVFKLLLSIFKSVAEISGKRHEVRLAIRILKRVPYRWYANYGRCSDLEKLLYGLQLCAARGAISSDVFLCSLLKQLPDFELEPGFATRILRSGRNYEVLVNYTAKRSNVDVLLSTLEFRKCVQNVMSSSASCLRVVLLINLADKGFYIETSVVHLESIYRKADVLTRGYLSVLILMYIRGREQDLSISLSELQQNVRSLISMSGSVLSNITFQKLAYLIN